MKQTAAPILSEACVFCSAPPDGERQSEGHVSVRFGDVGRGLRILLDGEDVGRSCFEALPGDDGWVILYVDPKRIHRRAGIPDHAFAVRRRGYVEVFATQPWVTA